MYYELLKRLYEQRVVLDLVGCRSVVDCKRFKGKIFKIYDFYYLLCINMFNKHFKLFKNFISLL